MGKIIDLTGKSFNRFKVLSFAGLKNGRTALWNCQCSCGTIKQLIGCDLKGGTTKSCGCLRRENGHKKATHGDCGLVRSREYRSWTKMKLRCLNKNYHEAHLYSGRGIKIYEPWLDYKNFIADMGRCPDGHSLDRIDVNGNYEPSNCRWADRYMQANNKRNNRIIFHNGRSDTLSNWCNELHVDYKRVIRRLSLGWSFEQAILPSRRPSPLLKTWLFVNS